MEPAETTSVVLHFRDGQTWRCQLRSSFSPCAEEIEIVADGGDVERIEVWALKAVFFPKDARQRHDDMARDNGNPIPPAHPVARVEFFDGEVIHGRVEHYSVENTGFWLYPTAPESNNERIFVVARSLHTVTLG
jgi:hypothetical protein